MSKRRKRLEARARRYPAPPRGARPAPYLPGVSGGIALGRVWIGTPLTPRFPVTNRTRASRTGWRAGTRSSGSLAGAGWRPCSWLRAS